MPSGLVCADFGLVHGDQTIGRAEILAIWSGIRMVMRTGSDLPITIYTDSQYAITMCRLVQRFKNAGVMQLSISTENYDILQEMLQRWPPNAIAFRKVKSHRPESSAADMEHLGKCSSGPLGRACTHTRAGYSQTSLGTNCVTHKNGAGSFGGRTAFHHTHVDSETQSVGRTG